MTSIMDAEGGREAAREINTSKLFIFKEDQGPRTGDVFTHSHSGVRVSIKQQRVLSGENIVFAHSHMGAPSLWST